MDQPIILIIDDDKFWRSLLARFLTSSKYTVHSAGSCTEGIALAGLHRPDCILLDYHLKDGDASDVCRSVRGSEEIKDTPIIILSSDPLAEESAYLDCSAEKFILKGEPMANIRLAMGNIIAASALRAKRHKSG